MDNVKITLLVITFINTLHALVLLRTHSSLGWPCEPRTDYVEVTMFSNKTYSSKICETKSQSDKEWQSSDQGLIKILAIPWYISNSKEVSWRQSIFHMEKTLSNDADNKQRIFRRRVTWSGQLYSRWYGCTAEVQVRAVDGPVEDWPTYIVSCTPRKHMWETITLDVLVMLLLCYRHALNQTIMRSCMVDVSSIEVVLFMQGSQGRFLVIYKYAFKIATY